MDVLPVALCDIVYSYFCDCEVTYFKNKDQKQICHLSHDQIRTCDIEPNNLFYHCCEQDMVEIVPQMDDSDFASWVAHGIVKCLDAPFSPKMMDWILNRLSQMDITYWKDRFLSDLFCSRHIDDEAGYNWFMKNDLPCNIPVLQLAIFANDVAWLSKLTFDKSEAIRYAIDNHCVQSLLYLCDNQISANIFEEMFDCVCNMDVNALYTHVTDKSNIDFEQLLKECMCVDTLPWIVAHIPDFNIRDYIEGLNACGYALECMEKFQVEVNTMSYKIRSDYIDTMTKVNPHFFKRDVETYWNKSVTVLRAGLERGGYLTRPLPEIDPNMPEMNEINESSLGDDVIRNYVDQYASKSLHFAWIEKHIARVYPEPNTIYNMLIDKVAIGTLFELCCQQLDWTTLNIRAMLPSVNTMMLTHVKDHLQALFTCALERQMKVEEIVTFAQTNGIPLKATNLELQMCFSRLNETSQLKLLQLFPQQCEPLVNNVPLKLLLRKRKRLFS